MPRSIITTGTGAKNGRSGAAAAVMTRRAAIRPSRRAAQHSAAQPNCRPKEAMASGVSLFRSAMRSGARRSQRSAADMEERTETTLGKEKR